MHRHREGLACTKCVDTLNNSAFKRGHYYVCINILCRRIWKQMASYDVSFFCHSCEQHWNNSTLLPQVSGRHSSSSFHDANLAQQQQQQEERTQTSTLARLQLIYKYWARVLSVLIKDQPLPPALSSNDDLQRTIDVFTAAFRDFHVPPEWCRNWTSMSGRRKYYKGRVEFKDPETRVCHIVPTCEVDNVNFAPTTTANRSFKDQKRVHPYFVLDWKDECELGAEVYFLSFPNPVREEKREDCFERIISIIPGPKHSPKDDEEEEQKPTYPATPCTYTSSPTSWPEIGYR